ncbi:dynein regulatory complex protein 10 isoform X2 [Nothoprocta perdicaria]|uniref:dynein regulatory complex protein 10 isoform X2 n=1 Tax=Nothoprocta perdicaria TaxID=30464 RepID=UPI000E1B72EA|nr:dynein regulatory complex protein 10 isoform X2 [Nothoprocta perdicaria]
MATGNPAVLQASSQDTREGNKPPMEGIQVPKKGGVRSDAMRVLGPSQPKLDTHETQRIIAVLDETIVKLELSSLIPGIMESLDGFADILGPEITSDLIEHQKLLSKMEELLSSSQEGQPSPAEEQRESLGLLERHLKRSVRDILRLLLASPSLCQALPYEVCARQSSAEAFIQTFREFRNFMHERLLTSPLEEKEKIQFMEDISLRIRRNTETLTALKAELAATIQSRDEKIHRKDNVIKDLKTSLQDVADNYKISVQQIMQEAENQQKEELRAWQARRARLQEDMEQLRAQLRALVLEHRESELALRKKCKVEMEIEKWIQKYDADMGEKQAEYEELYALYSEEKAQVSLLQEKHDVLIQEYSQIAEERSVRQQKQKQDSDELVTMTIAATRIQAFWRGYLVRSLFKTKRKKKKKGGGKNFNR